MVNRHKKIFNFKFRCNSCKHKVDIWIDRFISLKDIKCKKCKNSNIINSNNIKCSLNYQCINKCNKVLSIEDTDYSTFIIKMKELLELRTNNLNAISYMNLNKKYCTCN